MIDEKRTGTVQEILDCAALAVIRLADVQRLLPTIEAFLRGGIRGIEITLSVPDAMSQLRLVDRTFGADVCLGVGSVLDADQAVRALDAGARFVVSPIFNEDVVRVAHARSAPALPGAFTPTEIQRAHKAGADIVKVFPADVVGMAFFRGVLAPMPHLKLMPTGGVTLTNAGEWFDAGAVAVGVGSALVDKRAVADGDWALLEENARTLMNSIREEKMKIVTFGEIMLRLSTPGFRRFVQADSFDANYGGGEANVAVALANYGLESYFVSRLPAHEIGQAAVNSLRRFGVRTEYIQRGGDRVGIYFLETGASQRASKVIYDRANSSVATLDGRDVDWDMVFAGARWFHWTGITPALGQGPRNALEMACVAARKAGATISCDLNYRKKLWSEEEAQRFMRPLMQHVDVCIANEEDAHKSLGLEADGTDVDKGVLDESGYARLARSLKERFAFSAVAITLRESHSASRNGWSAMLLDERDCREPVRSRRYEIQLVDRVGGGDSFASGLIAGLLQKDNSRDALEFAVAASCLKQTIPGDVNLVSSEEVDKLAAGGGSGRVER